MGCGAFILVVKVVVILLNRIVQYNTNFIIVAFTTWDFKNNVGAFKLSEILLVSNGIHFNIIYLACTSSTISLSSSPVATSATISCSHLYLLKVILA